jgi:protease IV
MTKESVTGKIMIIVIVLLGLGMISIISSAILSLSINSDRIGTGNVAVIPIKGIITTAESQGPFAQGVASSGKIVSMIKKADANPQIKAILIEINSPGGTPVATDEIAQAIHSINKTTVAWIREAGASGAYWVASATDHIIANRMSVVGSIGVRGSYLEFSGLLKDYNITYEELYAGEYKEYGSPFKKLSEKEREKIMTQINKLHSIFISEIAKNRNLDYAYVEKLATGETYLGIEAFEYKLIDQTGGHSTAISYIEQKINRTVTEVIYAQPVTLVDILSSFSTNIGYQTGKGIGDSMLSQKSQSFLLK